MRATEPIVRRAVPALTVLLLVAVPLAGCIGGSGNNAEGPTTTDPTNNSSNLSQEDVEERADQTVVEIRNNTTFDPSSTFHTHDQWGQRTKITLMEPEDSQFSVDWAEYARRRALDEIGWIVDVPQNTEGGSIVPWNVYQGTGKIKYTLRWQDGYQSPGPTTYLNPSLCVTNGADGVPGSVSGICNSFNNVTWTCSSSPCTNTISFQKHDDILNAQTWDKPHTLKSNWRMAILPCSTATASCTPNQGISQFSLEMTIFRGNMSLPLDPPHFAFYGDKDSLTLLPPGTQVAGGSSVQAYLRSTGNTISWYVFDKARGDSLAWIYSHGADDFNDQSLSKLAETVVVPPKTKTMTVSLGWTCQLCQEQPVTLKYITAGTLWGDWQVPSSGATSCNGSASGNCTYTIPVGTSRADSLYAYNTQWKWGIFPANENPKPWGSFTLSLGITVQKGGTS